MSERRRFNSNERVALYLTQDGRCARCGIELEQGWHADHVNPWSHGGPTDIINGQALCPTCNLTKGNRVESIDLREWQKQAKRQYHVDGKKDWLACVTPGGGKTKWALSVASDLLHAGTIERVIVVVPTDNLRTQWTKQHTINLAILSNGDGVREPKPFQGCVVTYAQIASDGGQRLYRKACSQWNTLVIFDECHHAGDSQSWGQAIEHTFEYATRRVSMTGTPWRAPRSGKIPFVTYNADGVVLPDYKFTYGQAVQGKPQVCRLVQFYPYDGSVTYMNVDELDSCTPRTETVRLGEAEEDDSPILRDILRADGKWMSSILQKAVSTLEEIRLTVPDAKLLVVVNDRTEARGVAKLEKEIFHERPALIISDPEEGEPDPQKELEKFRKDQRKYAIAVDMVSEGVDIPPLYVCVYATRKKTPLRFQQIVGRVIRKRLGDDLPAIVFIPAIPSLMGLASEIDNMVSHTMDKEIDEIKKDTQERKPHDNEIDPIALCTSEAIRTGAISGGDSYHENELCVAETHCIEYGIPAIYAPGIAKLLRSQGSSTKDNATVAQSSPEEISLQEEWSRLRSLLDREVGSVAGIVAQKNGSDIGRAKRDWNAQVNGWYGKKRIKFSIGELQEALIRVRRMRETIRNGGEL
jgi:superfamily II DNA or RNA helicase